jgi:hypothetical protein
LYVLLSSLPSILLTDLLQFFGTMSFLILEALIVALFPTSGPQSPPVWTIEISRLFFGAEPGNIHYTAAALLFLNFTAIMGFFFRRALQYGRQFRAIEYAIVCSSMSLGVVVGITAWLLGWGEGTDFLYWLEFWMLAWYGFGWFRAGWYNDQDGGTQK